MKATIRINVTAEDIRRGKRQHSAACPVARALRRAGLKRATVGPVHWRPTGNATRLLPAKVAHFVTAFDSGDRVRPFRATLTTKGKE